ncbi:MAG: SpoIIE family protein phosphatase, partial [Clostridia bacterium]|nr:SpoIIE family protein phosphatase [Clostridia bacterium]
PNPKISVFSDETYGNIACAYSPIYNSAGEVVAVAGVDLSMERIRSEVLHNVLLVIFSVSVVTLLAGAVGFFVIRHNLVQPIQRLNNATKRVVENLDDSRKFSLDIHTHDELEELANSFGKMNDDLRDYLTRLAHVTAEKERIGAELNIATQIQADMLPRIFPPFPERKEFDLYASMTPAKEVGGDFYDFFLVDDTHLALVMADVSGKGVPAALFMVIAKTLIKNRALMGGSPSEILYDVNEQLCDGNESEYFVTVWLAIIDVTTGKGVAVNAGHEHPVLMRSGKRFNLVVYNHSPAVATIDGIPFAEHRFELRPGDRLFVYTDGVPEATNAQDELFGTGRMLDVLNRNADASPESLLQTVKREIDSFVGDAPQFDDVTMLCLDYYGLGG